MLTCVCFRPIAAGGAASHPEAKVLLNAGAGAAEASTPPTTPPLETAAAGEATVHPSPPPPPEAKKVSYATQLQRKIKNAFDFDFLNSNNEKSDEGEK